MKYKITATEMNAGRNMWSGEMMKALGLKPGGHLPDEGMPERSIQGIRVYVKPAKPYLSQRNYRLMVAELTSEHNSDQEIDHSKPHPPTALEIALKSLWNKYRIGKTSGHRVIAICPGCDRHLSAGRLHQHVCKVGGQAK